MLNIVASKWSTEIWLAHEYSFIFNNRKITEFNGLHDEKKNKNCVKAETETYKIQKLTYIADFQVLINGFYRNSFMH